MSRRQPPSRRTRNSANISTNVTDLTNNPYQVTTLPLQNGYHPQTSNHKHHQHHHQDFTSRCQSNCRNGCSTHQTTIDIGYSDETTDTQSYYEYYQENGFAHSPLRESRNTDCTFSDDSGSTRLPYYEFDDESNKRYSRHAHSENSFRRTNLGKDMKMVHPGHSKDHRKVYPDTGWDRLYQEIPSPCEAPPVNNIPKRLPVSRLSDRPQSSMSSGVTSAMVHGCGGKCQTFENVCYFFLQLVFTMGILVGISLCIAGLVLKKSAARKLQVLVYIGVLLALVSGLLLGIQCNARKSAKKRKKAIQNAKRAPIQLENLQFRINPAQQQTLMRVTDMGHQRMAVGQKIHTSLVRPHQTGIYCPPDSPSLTDEQGIPWWRRNDLNPK